MLLCYTQPVADSSTPSLSNYWIIPVNQNLHNPRNQPFLLPWRRGPGILGGVLFLIVCGSVLCVMLTKQIFLCKAVSSVCTVAEKKLSEFCMARLPVVDNFHNGTGTYSIICLQTDGTVRKIVKVQLWRFSSTLGWDTLKYTVLQEIWTSWSEVNTSLSMCVNWILQKYCITLSLSICFTVQQNLFWLSSQSAVVSQHFHSILTHIIQMSYQHLDFSFRGEV